MTPSQKQEGNYSLLIHEDPAAASKSFGACALNILSKRIGTTVTVKGYLKTENVKNGWAGLWMRINDEEGVLEFDNMQKEQIKGTNDWKEYTITLPLSEDAEKIVIGGLLVGEGKLWVDNFKVYFDSIPIERAPLKTNTDATSLHPPVILTAANDLQLINLSALCKVWGLLKYYHPAVAKGEFDMDEKLFEVLPKVINCKTKKEFNDTLQQWIATFGIVKACNSCKEPKKDIAIAPDFKWLTDNLVFTKETIDALTFIKQNPNTGKHYYVNKMEGTGNPEFKHEKTYVKFTKPDVEFRILCLYRYWNMIQYFFPYKDVIGEDWNAVIPEFILKYMRATDSISYRLTTLELIGRIHDTHANIYGNTLLENYKGHLHSPAQVKFIENKAVITGYYNKKLADTSLLHIGDIITKINSMPVEAIIKEQLPLSPASNYSTQLRNIAADLLRSSSNIMSVEVLRNNKTLTLSIPLVQERLLDIYKDYTGPSDTCFKLLPGNICYFNLGNIKASYLPGLMKTAEHTKGMLIDLRCYPSDFMVYEMDKYLLPSKTAFAKFTSCNSDYPGYFEFIETVYNGRPNKNYYKGKVVILVNEVTQSQAEYTTMALRTAPHAMVIGSTTAGADGDVSAIILPGGIRSMISGLGVFYPDGKPTQRVGIIPDLKIEPTIEGIKKGKDEVLEKAMEVIKGK